MEKSEISAALIQIVSKEAGLDTSLIDYDTQLIGDGVNLNSMKILMLIMAVENHFGIHFKPDTFTENHFKSIATLAELVRWTIEEEISTVG